MRELIDQISNWYARGERVALATVVSTWGSSPRPVGSLMAVASSGQIAGSVSGGCVEAVVAEKALAILAGASPELLQFGVSDETAWGVSLACGGSIEVFVAGLNKIDFDRLTPLIEQNIPFIFATVLTGPGESPGKIFLVDEDGIVEQSHELEPVTDWIASQANELLTDRTPRRVTLENSPGIELFINLYQPPDRLVIIGGVHIAIALAKLAKELGYETIIVDPRRLFASEERFPGVDRLIQSWPQEALAEVGLTASTAVAVLTHDPKIDDPAIIAALQSPAYYIGVLGSRRTHAARVERLRAAGVAEEAITTLHAPIGLDLGGQSPEEVALSILAEIVASRRKA